jgi:hypothetical protein
MTAPHRGRPGGGPPDMLASGRWRGHDDRPASLTAARRGVAAMAAVAVALAAGWAGRNYITGSWRYWIEHRRPLTPGLLCPTYPGQAMPGPGMLAAIADLGRGIPSGAVARHYGCQPASSIFDPQPRAPLPRGTTEVACAPGRARPGPGRSRTRRPAGHDHVGHDGVVPDAQPGPPPDQRHPVAQQRPQLPHLRQLLIASVVIACGRRQAAW